MRKVRRNLVYIRANKEHFREVFIIINVKYLPNPKWKLHTHAILENFSPIAVDNKLTNHIKFCKVHSIRKHIIWRRTVEMRNENTEQMYCLCLRPRKQYKGERRKKSFGRLSTDENLLILCNRNEKEKFWKHSAMRKY